MSIQANITISMSPEERAVLDKHLRAQHPDDWFRRRSEFIRQAIADAIARHNRAR